MTKDWKEIEGKKLRIDVGSTLTEAIGSSMPAETVCFTTDGYIVLNGVVFSVSTEDFNSLKDMVNGQTVRIDEMKKILDDLSTDKADKAYVSEAIAKQLEGYATEKWVLGKNYSNLGITGTYYSGNENAPKEAHANIDAWNNRIYLPLASDTINGAMSADDKSKLDEIDEYAQENKIEHVKLGGEDLSISGKSVNITSDGIVSMIPKVSTSTDGLMSKEDKQGLDMVIEGIDQKADLDGDGYVAEEEMNPALSNGVVLFAGIKAATDGGITFGQDEDQGSGRRRIIFDPTDHAFYQEKTEGKTITYFTQWPGYERTGHTDKKNIAIPFTKPYANRLYIDTNTSKAYYYNGETLESIAGSGSTDDIPKDVEERIATLERLMTKVLNALTMA